jgi:hypothetical protein
MQNVCATNVNPVEQLTPTNPLRSFQFCLSCSTHQSTRDLARKDLARGLAFVLRTNYPIVADSNQELSPERKVTL